MVRLTLYVVNGSLYPADITAWHQATKIFSCMTAELCKGCRIMVHLVIILTNTHDSLLTTTFARTDAEVLLWLLADSNLSPLCVKTAAWEVLNTHAWNPLSILWVNSSKTGWFFLMFSAVPIFVRKSGRYEGWGSFLDRFLCGSS